MDQHEADAVIRASWPARRPLPHCSGACDQGRKPCMAPDACQVAEPDEDISTPIVVPLLVLVAAIFATVLLLHWTA